MMRIGILQLPYNLDNLRQLLDQLAGFDGHVSFIDLPSRIDETAVGALPENIAFVPCESFDVAPLATLCKALRLHDLIAFADLGLLPAARVRQALAMGGHDVEVELNSIDKYRMRRRLIDAGLSGVDTQMTTAGRLGEAIADFGLPAIAKPTRLTGSIGVQLLRRSDEVSRYVARLEGNSYSKGCELMLERFVPGAEYSVEGMLLHGKAHFYGVTEKQTTEEPYFVEVGHRFDANHPLLPLLERSLPAVFDALGMNLCPFHVEFKVVDAGIEIIEVHSRFGGDFITKLVEYSLGSKVFLEYLDYLCFATVPSLARQQAAISIVHFAVVPPGRVASVTPLSESFASTLLDYKVAIRAGDVVVPKTGYYDRPAYFIALLKDDADSRRFQQSINAFSITIACEELA